MVATESQNSGTAVIAHVVLGKVIFVILGFNGNQAIQLLRQHISIDIDWKEKITLGYITHKSFIR